MHCCSSLNNIIYSVIIAMYSSIIIAHLYYIIHSDCCAEPTEHPVERGKGGRRISLDVVTVISWY